MTERRFFGDRIGDSARSKSLEKPSATSTYFACLKAR